MRRGGRRGTQKLPYIVWKLSVFSFYAPLTKIKLTESLVNNDHKFFCLNQNYKHAQQ